MTETLCSVECLPEEEGYIDPEHLRKIKHHPCFSKEAQHIFGRIHLPVAPKCNIKCNYCVRRFDCVNESRPGVTSQVLTPLEALDRVKMVIANFPNIKVVAVAGPGEPLANEETFEILRLVKENFPYLQLCMSTNGLLLPEKLDLIHELGVSTITVTMNAVDPKIGKEIYSWVRYHGKILRGLKAAELLLANQLAGVSGAVERGIVVKVNSVMSPSINDHHLVEVAKKARELGVYTLNIMPLIPQDKFGHLKPPTPVERKQAQEACSAFIRQMRHCRQCRSDAIGLLSQDLSQTVFKPIKVEIAGGEMPDFKVAVTGSLKGEMVDLHFEETREFLIYEVKGDTAKFVGTRKLKLEDNKQALSQAAELLADCKYVITRRIGTEGVSQLNQAGIKVVADYDRIEEAIKRSVKELPSKELFVGGRK